MKLEARMSSGENSFLTALNAHRNPATPTIRKYQCPKGKKPSPQRPNIKVFAAAKTPKSNNPPKDVKENKYFAFNTFMEWTTILIATISMTTKTK